MRRWISPLGIILICLFTTIPVFSSEINLPNFSFEDGLAEWTVMIAPRHGDIYFINGEFDQPYAGIVTTHTGNDPHGRITYGPQEGSCFLELNTRGYGHDAKSVSVFRTFEAQAGDTLSGMAAFDARVNGRKRIYVAESASATINYDPVYFRNALQIGTKGDDPWTMWQWEAPYDGTFTLMYMLTSPLNRDRTSYAMFDAVTNVPIPSSLLIFVTGLLGLIVIKRRKLA
jgi:hypothetical protein